MNDSSNVIPDWVFDSVDNTDFSNLEADVKAEVLKYLDEASYTEMRKASLVLRSFAIEAPEPSPQLKSKLMEAFSNKHVDPVVNGISNKDSRGRFRYLKVAAVISVIFSAAMALSYRLDISGSNFKNNTGCDTNNVLKKYDTASIQKRDSFLNRIHQCDTPPRLNDFSIIILRHNETVPIHFNDKFTPINRQEFTA
ncbi:MAG TPA: hypothetical protein VGF79_06020 [Bacteroidia bacterium]